MRRRLRMQILGAVQGVGFRPFVHRLAGELSLAGWVINDTRGVVLEVEGKKYCLDRFLERLAAEKPAPAVVQHCDVAWLEPAGYSGFLIKPSDGRGVKTVQVLPDIATCPACLDELFDPGDRRYRYPFTNCTHCGPRLSIVRSLPYDRPRTTMRGFEMCPACRAEYENPGDRRFHAQPNACPDCGPHPEFWNAAGEPKESREAAIESAVETLKSGGILAVKGLGGFHLMVDARNGSALGRLRTKKPRREKPLAVMVRDLEQAKLICDVDEEATAVLQSPEAPIILLARNPGAAGHVHESVAPANPYLGVMLPYTPLHHLILRSVDFPVVATSGNLSEEPICTDESEAVRRLGSIADAFLIHDRPIARHVDDSVVWILDGRTSMLRRARGHAPRPVLMKSAMPVILAVGGHLKNTVALSVERQVFVSQHIGDMETPEAVAAFEGVISDFLSLYGATPVVVAHDLHPDYPSTQWARGAVSGDGSAGVLEGLPLVPVQHHHAHLAAALLEHFVEGPALGVTWDGTGYGPDGTIWGGEFLVGTRASFQRVAHLRAFRLPGGEAAIREPRRTALSLLREIGGEAVLEWDDLDPVSSFEPAERRVILRMLDGGLNAPLTSSAGRLFDGVAALIGLKQRITFEGQAAMALELATDRSERGAYPVELSSAAAPRIIDWRPMVRAVVEDLRRGVAKGVIAARFHNTLARMILIVAREADQPIVVLTGGCFQNRLLVEASTAWLRDAGFKVLLHRKVPPNDGGISLGQISVVAARLSETGAL